MFWKGFLLCSNKKQHINGFSLIPFICALVDVFYVQHFCQAMFLTFWRFVPVDVINLLCFVSVGIFSILRFVPFGVFLCYFQSMSFWRLVPVDVFYSRRFLQSTFFTADVSYCLRFCPSLHFFHSTFCPIRRFFHSIFCPIRYFFFDDVLSIYVFYGRLFLLRRFVGEPLVVWVFNFRFFKNFAKHKTMRKLRLFRENFACFVKLKYAKFRLVSFRTTKIEAKFRFVLQIFSFHKYLVWFRKKFGFVSYWKRNILLQFIEKVELHSRLHRWALYSLKR